MSTCRSPPRCRYCPSGSAGKDLFWWLTRLGLLRVTVDTRPGRRMSSRDFIIGSSRRRLKAAGVRFRPAVAGADGRTVRFADGTSLDAEVVIWATGYRPDYSWIDIPGVTRDGKVIHRRGVTDVPGLYFLGLSWQHTRGSALLGFVHQDAAYLAGRITGRDRAAGGRHYAARFPAVGVSGLAAPDGRSPSAQRGRRTARDPCGQAGAGWRRYPGPPAQDKESPHVQRR